MRLQRDWPGRTPERPSRRRSVRDHLVERATAEQMDMQVVTSWWPWPPDVDQQPVTGLIEPQLARHFAHRPRKPAISASGAVALKSSQLT